uniref:Tumor necrosis factor receptor 10B n=1 Tax=Lethenteron reissneri TaxID=7753 RepID=A0A650EIV7_LETRI|nr:tumor necrosis factor receptor 10B [Lethenteron reissneri]
MLAAFSTAIEGPAVNSECAKGSYRSQIGHCCLLCRAGSYKKMDCASEGQEASCEVCPRDQYMDQDNNAPRCENCSRCREDEEAVVICSVAQDTKCDCKDGLNRDPTSDTCVPIGVNWLAILFGIIVTILVFIILAFVAFKLKLFPDRSTEQAEEKLNLIKIQVQRPEEQNIRNLIQENKEILTAWIGMDPFPILDYMDTHSLIPRDVYNGAKKERGRHCANFLLLECIAAGNSQCQKLLEALLDVQDSYPDIKTWLIDLDIKRLIPTFEGIVCKKVRRAKPDLKHWIGVETQPLVEHMKRQNSMMMQQIPDNLSTSSDLIDFVIDNGEEFCGALVSALKDLPNQYPNAQPWLQLSQK